jgi:hypothetical protein
VDYTWVTVHVDQVKLTTTVVRSRVNPDVWAIYDVQNFDHE